MTENPSPEDLGLKRNRRREMGPAHDGFKERGNYGVSQADAYEAGDYILFVTANALRFLAADSHSLPGPYLQKFMSEHGLEDRAETVDAAHEAWCVELLEHSDVFMRYWEGDAWGTQADVDKFGGVIYDDLQLSLDWLRENILSLWS